MPLLDTLPVGPDTAQWEVWGTTARVVVTDPAKLPAARALVEAELAAVDAAASRFRHDSELRRLDAAAGDAHARGGGEVVAEVSPLLAELVQVALDAAERSHGDVDPTVGAALAALGYDRDLADLPAHAPAVRVVIRPVPGWRRVRLDGRRLTVPAGLRLDLGATAKAHAADRCAATIADRCDIGVLVALGGDIATAGQAPDGGWRILVQDHPGQPHCTIALPAGAALATSSTTSRQWRRGDQLLHHILDPRTCQPAAPVWRTVSVAAERCVDANMLTTAALVRGHAALPWLCRASLPARLVTSAGDVITLGGWPEERP